MSEDEKTGPGPEEARIAAEDTEGQGGGKPKSFTDDGNDTEGQGGGKPKS